MTHTTVTNKEQASKELSATHADTNGITYICSLLIKEARYSQDVKEIQHFIERAITMTGYKGAVQTAGELLRFEHLLLAVYRYRLIDSLEKYQSLHGYVMPNTDAAYWQVHLGYAPDNDRYFTANELDMIRGNTDSLLASIYQYS